MTVTEVPTSAGGNPIGFGRMLRKEDARFLRGKGNYVDDIDMPGMLYGAILRSPVAHALIKSIDTSAAEAHPKVKAVITGAVLETLGLAWVPTLSYDTAAVLATDKVRFQGQEVAFVVAEDKYSARDALELIEVEYEILPAVIDAKKALDPGAPVIRTDKEGKTDNHIFDWEAGDEAKCDAAFAKADVIVKQDMLYPRVHPSPMETCGAVADMNKATGQLTIWCTSQAPHAHRTIYALVAGLPEQKIRVVSPDIGGGFGNKVGIYSGYVLAIVGSIVTGKPVKWMEDRSEHLMSTAFARDYHMHGEIAATKEGKILGVRVNVLADHGCFNGTAQPTKFPAGFFHIFTGSYDYEAAHCKVTGVYTNKAPGGVAYACSFRITEAVYLVERLVDCLAMEMKVDPAELRLKNLLRAEQFPYTTPTGWEYDSGNYAPALREAMRIAGYDELRAEQAARRARRAAGDTSEPMMGIGTLVLHRRRRRGAAQAHGHPRSRHGRRRGATRPPDRQGPTAAELHDAGPGAPDDLRADRRPGAGHPSGGHRGHAGRYRQHTVRPRHLRVAFDACQRWCRGDRGTRRVRDKARIVAAAALECSPDDLEWELGRWQVKGDPEKGKTIQEIAMLSHSSLELPDGVEGHLDGQCVYDPPNLTYPFGAYICVTDVDPGTGRGQGSSLHRRRRLRSAYQSDDRRGPGARRPCRRNRDGADAGDRLRRGGQQPGWLVHGLPVADVDGVPVVGAGRDQHAIASSPARREGRR